MLSSKNDWSWWLIALALLLLFMVSNLSGCMSARVIERPVYVDVPVPVPCVRFVPEEPSYETARLKLTDPIGVVGQAYRIERRQLRQYIAVLQAELVGCMMVDG